MYKPVSFEAVSWANNRISFLQIPRKLVLSELFVQTDEFSALHQ